MLTRSATSMLAFMMWAETSHGRVPVWGSFDSDRPLVLAIRGAFPTPDHLADLEPPGADLALVHLPGHHSPRLRTTSIVAFISAFDQVIENHWRGRQVTVVGVSTGALVALGLRSPEVRGVLAVEPFFSTAKLWPMVEFAHRELRTSDQAALHDWMDAIFGYTLAGVTDRNYEAVLKRRDRPATMLVGDVPLNPRRPVRGMPSLTDEDDRRRLPCRVSPGGHDIPIDAIRAALADLHEDDHYPTTGARARGVAAST
jgi:pimeloyl-ACP methyl ester carboxylesterase